MGTGEIALPLYDHTLKVTGRNDHIYRNRGAAYDRTWQSSGRRLRILTRPSRSIQNMLMPITTGALPMANLATTGRQSSIITGPSKSIQNMLMPITIGAYAYSELGNREQAIVDYNRAIEVDPKHARPIITGVLSMTCLATGSRRFRIIIAQSKSIQICRGL